MVGREDGEKGGLWEGRMVGREDGGKGGEIHI